jgi:hypothetical protein
MMVKVTGEVAKTAVMTGEILGELYADGEVWADVNSLREFYRLNPTADSLPRERVDWL